MSKLKLLKKIFMESFQWLAFSTPIFVTGQRLATVNCATPENCPGNDDTEYWLVIAGIIAYVAGITLVLWLPLKIFVAWKKVVRPYEGLWFPGNLLYIIFSAVPCVVLICVGHTRCDEHENCFDYFRGAPLETFVIMMVVTDWSEKIRYIRLRSDDDSTGNSLYTTAPPDQRNSIAMAGIADLDGTLNPSRRTSISRASLLHPSVRKGTVLQRIARGMKWMDARPENLLRDLMLAYDVRILLDLSLLSTTEYGVVFTTVWVYPIYILATLSFLPLVLAPKSEMRSCTTVFLQDIPFFILRIAIFGYFGSELVLSTSVLYLLKNFFVALAFIYFNIILPRRIAKRKKNEYQLNTITEASQIPYQTDRNNPVAETVLGGVANPAYQSRRYDSPELDLRGHHARASNFSDSPGARGRDDYGGSRHQVDLNARPQRTYSRREDGYGASPYQRSRQYSQRNAGYDEYPSPSQRQQHPETPNSGYSEYDASHYRQSRRYSTRDTGYDGYPPPAQRQYSPRQQNYTGSPNAAQRQGSGYGDQRAAELRRKPSTRDVHQDDEWSDQEYPDQTPMYASFHTATIVDEQRARTETIPHEIPVENSTPTQKGGPNQEPANAEPQTSKSPMKKVINYESLNDPKSFLYNQDDVPRKPRVYEIDFEGQSQQPQTSNQNPPQGQNSATNFPTQSAPTQSTPSRAANADVVGSSSQEKRSPTDPVYAQVDLSKKSSRRKAPPPPTKKSPAPPIPDQMQAALPPPPPDLLDEHEHTVPNGDISRDRAPSKYQPSKRGDSMYTQSLAQTLAVEAALKRAESASRKREEDAVKSLDDAWKMHWSGSTTPKSTVSGRKSNAPVINDEDYDERL